ncbi:hypothetical protein [Flavobacterium sp. SLB02]|uniref:hypothetical protein n=1 Tax=Flavobacterium sp. SLB02 TaxID=2665645 RepID=UPI0012AA0E14|nr:hypothetical protein [Flavobacterium sp. SLB02]QGK74466.1 hypothetical protein GIY83_10500 [Flavobacterium sp. SLB02]
MKKLFLWYSGTDTTAESMRNFFNITETDTIKVEYINGLGTEGNISKTNTLQNNDAANEPGLINKFTNYIYKLYTRAKGAQEHDQVAQIEHFFKITENTNSDEEVELIIGGHSRGAAVGILGLIASLYETCRLSSFENSSIKKITFIAVDPVPGSSKVLGSSALGSKNDLLGFETIGGENKIKTALDFIATRSKKPNLFKVIYYPARFDMRNEFKADQYWLDFYENQCKNLNIVNPKNDKPVIETKFYIGGFRHSAMVNKTEEISELYDEINCPTNLLKEIVYHELEISNSDLNAIQEGIIKTENDVLALVSNIKNLKLTERTTKDSYPLEIKAEKILYSGESLEQIIRNRAKNNSAKINKKNNRYLGL